MRLAAVVILALTGCNGASVPEALQPQARGPCEIELLNESGEPLERPYVLTLQPVLGGPPAAEVALKGSGWSGSVVEIRVTAPSGPRPGGGMDAASINEGRGGQIFNEPGSWALEFEDANCLRRVDVEVRPVAALPTASAGESCGPLTVSNQVDALADGGEPESIVLDGPFVATMGERTISNQQIAAIQFMPAKPWSDPVVHLKLEPAPADDMGVEIDNPSFNRAGWEHSFGTPGTKRLVFTGMVTNCQTVIDVQVVLDTELRAKDVDAGLTQPPEPAGPP